MNRRRFLGLLGKGGVGACALVFTENKAMSNTFVSNEILKPPVPNLNEAHVIFSKNENGKIRHKALRVKLGNNDEQRKNRMINQLGFSVQRTLSKMTGYNL